MVFQSWFSRSVNDSLRDEFESPPLHRNRTRWVFFRHIWFGIIWWTVQWSSGAKVTVLLVFAFTSSQEQCPKPLNYIFVWPSALQASRRLWAKRRFHSRFGFVFSQQAFTVCIYLVPFGACCTSHGPEIGFRNGRDRCNELRPKGRAFTYEHGEMIIFQK